MKCNPETEQRAREVVLRTIWAISIVFTVLMFFVVFQDPLMAIVSIVAVAMLFVFFFVMAWCAGAFSLCKYPDEEDDIF